MKKRVRFSGRLIRYWRGAHWAADRFEQGTVYRLWLGYLFLKCMVGPVPPACYSQRFGPRMYCSYPDGHAIGVCKHCGLPWEPMTQEQALRIELGRSEMWWRKPND